MTQLREVSDEEDVADEDLFGKEEEVKEKWDCESILSTYSNLYNHPRLIEEPKVCYIVFVLNQIDVTLFFFINF